MTPSPENLERAKDIVENFSVASFGFNQEIAIKEIAQLIAQIRDETKEEDARIAEGYACMNCVNHKPCVCPKDIAKAILATKTQGGSE